MEDETINILSEKGDKLWVSYGGDDGECCRNVGDTPDWQGDFWDHDGQGDDDVVENEGDGGGDDSPHQEEAVDHVELLQGRHLLMVRLPC